MEILKEDFYGRKTLQVAKELLGKYLIHEVNGKIIGGKIDVVNWKIIYFNSPM